MSTVYTKVNKASGTSYTKISGGNVLFNDPSVIFDDAKTLFDGTKISYTKVGKPTGSGFAYTTWASTSPLTWSGVGGITWTTFTNGIYTLIAKAV